VKSSVSPVDKIKATPQVRPPALAQALPASQHAVLATSNVRRQTVALIASYLEKDNSAAQMDWETPATRGTTAPTMLMEHGAVPMEQV